MASNKTDYSSSKNLLAICPKKGTSNRSSVSASRYARMVRKAIKPRSQRKKSQPKNMDHEKRRCITKIAVKSSADCHAWNLMFCQLDAIPPQTTNLSQAPDSPHVVTLPLQYQQHDRPERWQYQIRQACLVV